VFRNHKNNLKVRIYFIARQEMVIGLVVVAGWTGCESRVKEPSTPKCHLFCREYSKKEDDADFRISKHLMGIVLTQIT